MCFLSADCLCYLDRWNPFSGFSHLVNNVATNVSEVLQVKSPTDNEMQTWVNPEAYLSIGVCLTWASIQVDTSCSVNSSCRGLARKVRFQSHTPVSASWTKQELTPWSYRLQYRWSKCSSSDLSFLCPPSSSSSSQEVTSAVWDVQRPGEEAGGGASGGSDSEGRVSNLWYLSQNQVCWWLRPSMLLLSEPLLRPVWGACPSESQ